MNILEPSFDLDQFFEQVAAAPERALLLDYDGTLAPFRVERDQAVPFPGVRELLESLMRQGRTRLVIISGRAIKDLLPLLGIAQSPEVWGSHGWERLLPSGAYQLAGWDERQARGLAAARAWVHDHGLADQCEEKPASLAIHWRGLPEGRVRRLDDDLQAHWGPLAEQSQLVLHRFDGGVELRIPGRDKGLAVQAILSELGEQAAVAFLGDDLTDEDGFKALKGRGASILVRPERRPTAADLWIEPPEELLAFLERWRRAAELSKEEHQ